MRQGAVVAGAGVLALVAALSRLRRLEVVGDSMAPTLVGGDRVLVLRLPRAWPLRPGTLVAVRDPRSSDPTGSGLDERLLVKRLLVRTPGGFDVRGDRPEASTDSRHFGPVPRRAVVGRVLYRYAPPHRAGRLR
jgi:nickel-type superoxide dismutase maturation protease